VLGIKKLFLRALKSQALGKGKKKRMYNIIPPSRLMKYSLRQGYDKSMALLVFHTQAGLQAYAVLGKLCHDDNLDLAYTIAPWPFLHVSVQ